MQDWYSSNIFHFPVAIFVILLTKAIFWAACFFVVYPYIIYPLILVALNRLGLGKGRQSDNDKADDSSKNPETGKFCPSVSMIIAAYNEEDVIGRKIDNALNLTYPESVEIIVISDGSSDNTASIVNEYCQKHANVRLVSMSTQSGKTVGLNTAVPLANGDILVFTDANAMYDKDALIHLLEPFSDSDVGYCVGSALYLEEDTEAVNVSEGLYWRYELGIKKLESEFYSVVGGDGAIYAIRKPLYQALESYDISDFVNPLQIISKDYRGVFVAEARCYEHGTHEFSDEFRRKRRIVNRSWGAVRRNLSLFSVSRHARFLFMLISHKVIRWWSLPLIVIAIISGILLTVLSGNILYLLLTMGVLGSVAVGFLGWQLDDTGTRVPRVVYLLYYFYLISFAGQLGIYDEFRGRRQSVWQPSR